MSENTQPVGSTSVSSSPEWEADSQLDKQEKYNAEKEAEKFHKQLTQLNTDSPENEGGYTRDRKSKLTQQLLSRNNLAI
ncbi:MAG: hypothetical protein ACR2PT_13675 [Endozoicomonas sp.]